MALDIGTVTTASFKLLKRSAITWCLVESAESMRCLADEPHVKAWEVYKDGIPFTVKFSTVERMFEAAPQATVALDTGCDEPLIILPVQTINIPRVGAFSISPFAGEVVSGLRANEWAHLSSEELEKKCKVLAICLLYTMLRMGTDEVTGYVKYLHKDIKLQNICYNRQGDYFVLIDWGGFSSTNKRLWVDVRDMRYLDPQMARYDRYVGAYAAHDAELAKDATSHTTDLFLMALAVVDLYCGGLPKEIDITQCASEVDYLEALWEYDWSSSPELAAMSPEMRDFLLPLLQRDPADRPDTADEVLDHDWLQDTQGEVDDRLEAADKPWQNMMQRLRDHVENALTGSSSIGSSDSGSSSCCTNHPSGSSSGASTCSFEDDHVQQAGSTLRCSSNSSMCAGSICSISNHNNSCSGASTAADIVTVVQQASSPEQHSSAAAGRIINMQPPSCSTASLSYCCDHNSSSVSISSSNGHTSIVGHLTPPAAKTRSFISSDDHCYGHEDHSLVSSSCGDEDSAQDAADAAAAPFSASYDAPLEARGSGSYQHNIAIVDVKSFRGYGSNPATGSSYSAYVGSSTVQDSHTFSRHLPAAACSLGSHGIADAVAGAARSLGSVGYLPHQIMHALISSSSVSAVANSYHAACPGGVSPRSDVLSVSAQTTEEPLSDSGVHVMLVVVQNTGRLDTAAAAAASVCDAQTQVISDADVQVSPQAMQDFEVMYDCCWYGEPQQQQNVQGGQAASGSDFAQPSSNNSSGSDKKLRCLKALKSSLKSKLKRACGLVACVLSGVQYSSHR